MSSESLLADSETMKLGLLMETAQSQQRLAEASLKKLKLHTHDLDSVVREEIRRTVINELHALAADSQQAVDALQRLKRVANARIVVWSLGITALCSALSVGVAWWTLPTRAEIAALRKQRDEFSTTIERLDRQGARIDLQHCGPEHRLCVRIDRRAPAYGTSADYLVVQGY